MINRIKPIRNVQKYNSKDMKPKNSFFPALLQLKNSRKQSPRSLLCICIVRQMSASMGKVGSHY